MGSRQESPIATSPQNTEQSRCNSTRPSTFSRRSLSSLHERVPLMQNSLEKKPPTARWKSLRQENPPNQEEERGQEQPQSTERPPPPRDPRTRHAQHATLRDI